MSPSVRRPRKRPSSSTAKAVPWAFRSITAKAERMSASSVTRNASTGMDMVGLPRSCLEPGVDNDIATRPDGLDRQAVGLQDDGGGGEIGQSRKKPRVSSEGT